MRVIGNANSDVERQPFGRQRVKILAAATIAYGGLLFPPERGEHGPPFRSRKWKPSATIRHSIKCR